MKKALFLILFIAFQLGAFSQGIDISKYKLKFQGKEIQAKELDSLQKVYGSFDIEKDTRTSPPTLNFIPTTAASMAKDQAEHEKQKGEWLNKTLPDFEIKDINNKTISKPDLANKIVVINLYFTTCNPCIREMPELNKLVAEYQGKDVTFLAFAPENSAKIKEFLKKTPFAYRQIPAAKDLIQGIFKINTYPTHMVIDKEGKIIYFTQGFGNNTIAELSSTLEKLTSK